MQTVLLRNFFETLGTTGLNTFCENAVSIIPWDRAKTYREHCSSTVTGIKGVIPDRDGLPCPIPDSSLRISSLVTIPLARVF
jgi:hypothetical protein